MKLFPLVLPYCYNTKFYLLMHLFDSIIYACTFSATIVKFLIIYYHFSYFSPLQNHPSYTSDKIVSRLFYTALNLSNANNQENVGNRTNVIFVREQNFTRILFISQPIMILANFLTNFGDPFSIQTIFCRSPNVQTRNKMPCPARHNFLN